MFATELNASVTGKVFSSYRPAFIYIGKVFRKYKIGNFYEFRMGQLSGDIVTGEYFDRWSDRVLIKLYVKREGSNAYSLYVDDKLLYVLDTEVL